MFVVSVAPSQPQLSEAGSPFRPDIFNVNQQRCPHQRVRRRPQGRDLRPIGTFL
jgi:hypothetical protein